MRRLNFKYITKNKTTWLRDVSTKYSIKVDLSGGKHRVYDVTMYQNGGSTEYVEVFNGWSLEQCKRKVRSLLNERG